MPRGVSPCGPTRCELAHTTVLVSHAAASADSSALNQRMSATGLSGRTTSERPKKLALRLRGSAAAPLMAARTDCGKKTGALEPAPPGGRGGREA